MDGGRSWLFKSSFQSPCSSLCNVPTSKVVVGYYKVVLILNRLTETCVSQGTCTMENLDVDDNAFNGLWGVSWRLNFGLWVAGLSALGHGCWTIEFHSGCSNLGDNIKRQSLYDSWTALSEYCISQRANISSLQQLGIYQEVEVCKRK